MDMKNVCTLVSLYSALEGVEFDINKVRSLGVKVFGNEEDFEVAFEQVISTWGGVSNETAEQLFLDILEEVYVAIKADIEAEALKEKENAS